MGAEIIQERFENAKKQSRDKVAEQAKVEVLQNLKQIVRPEFINRIDEIVMFTPLNLDEITQIVDIHLKGLTNLLANKEITLTATEYAKLALAKKGYDPEFGARPVKRVIQKSVLNLLSKDILAGKISNNSHIVLDAIDEQLFFKEVKI